MAAYERVTLNRGGRNSRFDCMLSFNFWKVNDRSCHSEPEQITTNVQG